MRTSTSPLTISQEVRVAMALAQLRQRCENRPTSMIFDSHGFQAGGESPHCVVSSIYCHFPQLFFFFQFADNNL